MTTKQLPIGYYLKLADNSLTKGIDEIQAQYDLNRVEWQVLNAIYGKSEILKSEIIELMQPMASTPLVETIFSKFADQKLVEFKGSMLTLTAEGRKLHQSCFDTQQAFRKKAMNDISETDYQITIATLQKIIANIS